jgi:hypothetical protein
MTRVCGVVAVCVAVCVAVYFAVSIAELFAQEPATPTSLGVHAPRVRRKTVGL